MKGINDLNKIRRDMMELWKHTFHDSTRYINIVFDTYFHPENAFTFYDGEKLVAALLGVEYQFQRRDTETQIVLSKGLYLCGLATLPAYRRHGIMAQLMKEAENSAKERGFSLTFLIPADASLRDYYGKKGYKTKSFLVHKSMERNLERSKDKLHIYTFRELTEIGNNDFIKEVSSWCSNLEKRSESITTILHSPTDFTAIITENENSIFITDSSFDLKNPILAKVRAVVFPTPFEEENHKIWRLSGVFIDEKYMEAELEGNKNIMPDFIQESLQAKYPDREFQLNIPFTGKNEDIMDKTPYAMIKYMDEDENSSKNENGLFKIYLMLD